MQTQIPSGNDNQEGDGGNNANADSLRNDNQKDDGGSNANTDSLRE